MIDHYFKIQMQLSAPVELLTLLPTPIEVDSYSFLGIRVPSNFKTSRSCSGARDGILFSKVRGIFNLLIINFPEMEHHLGRMSSLVINPDFEEGIMWIAKGTSTLTAAQLVAVSSLVKMDMPVSSLTESESDNEDVI